jgi:hypothetical protein
MRYSRTRKNIFHRLAEQFQQSVYGRLAGYKHFNDANRLALDPAMCQDVGGGTYAENAR